MVSGVGRGMGVLHGVEIVEGKGAVLELNVVLHPEIGENPPPSPVPFVHVKLSSSLLGRPSGISDMQKKFSSIRSSAQDPTG